MVGWRKEIKKIWEFRMEDKTAEEDLDHMQCQQQQHFKSEGLTGVRLKKLQQIEMNDATSWKNRNKFELNLHV